MREINEKKRKQGRVREEWVWTREKTGEKGKNEKTSEKRKEKERKI